MHPSDHNSTVDNNQDMAVTLHALHTWGAFEIWSLISFVFTRVLDLFL